MTQAVERIERRWAAVATVLVVTMVVLATVAGVHQAAMPQRQVETIDPTTLHLHGEFIESNLGTEVLPDGSVRVRAIGQQYSFAPSCILVPDDTDVTIRATSADVVHGFLIAGSNVNLMLVPGFVSVIRAKFTKTGDRLMACHEFCGFGHQNMWAHVKVIDKAAFAALAASRRRVDCVP